MRMWMRRRWPTMIVTGLLGAARGLVLDHQIAISDGKENVLVVVHGCGIQTRDGVTRPRRVRRRDRRCTNLIRRAAGR